MIEARSARATGGVEIGAVDVHPAAADLHQRLGFLRQVGDAGGVEFEVIEEHRPAHIGELLHTDLRRAHSLGEKT